MHVQGQYPLTLEAFVTGKGTGQATCLLDIYSKMNASTIINCMVVC
jgi:hypothetical protein